MICNDCGSTRMRPSRLRRSDLRELFKLKAPIRCRRCMSRRYVSVWRLPPKKTPQQSPVEA